MKGSEQIAGMGEQSGRRWMGRSRLGLWGRSPVGREEEPQRPAIKRSLSARPAQGKGRIGGGEPSRGSPPLGRKFCRTDSKRQQPLDQYRAALLRFIHAYQSYQQMQDGLKESFSGLMATRRTMLQGTTPLSEGVVDLEKSLEKILPSDCMTEDGGADVSEDDLQKELEEIKASYKLIMEEKRDVKESLVSLGLTTITSDPPQPLDKEPSELSLDLRDDWTEHMKSVKLTLEKLKAEMAEMKKSLGACLPAHPSPPAHTPGASGEDGEKVEVEGGAGAGVGAQTQTQTQTSEEPEAAAQQTNKLLSENVSLREKLAALEQKLSTEEGENHELSIKEMEKKLEELKSLNDLGEEDLLVDKCEPHLWQQVGSFLSLLGELRSEKSTLEAKVDDSFKKITTLESIVKSQHCQLEQRDKMIESIQDMSSEVAMSEIMSAELKDEIKQLKDDIVRQKAKMNTLTSKYRPLKNENKNLKKQVETIEKKSWLKKMIPF